MQELASERLQLVVADIDISPATRAMFLGDMEATASLLFADTVQRDEYSSILDA